MPVVNDGRRFMHFGSDSFAFSLVVVIFLYENLAIQNSIKRETVSEIKV